MIIVTAAGVLSSLRATREGEKEREREDCLSVVQLLGSSFFCLDISDNLLYL